MDSDLSKPSETEKFRIPTSRLDRDDIINLAQIVEDASNKNSEFYGPGFVGKLAAGFLLEGGRKDFACSSLDALKSGRWPSDTRRVIMASTDPYEVRITVDSVKIDDNIAIVRGSDSSWVKSSMRTVEDIFKDAKSLRGLLLHRVAVWSLSCFLAFVGVNFLLVKLFLAQLVLFWSTPIYAFVACVFILTIGNAISDWVAKIVRFLIPYVDFEWNTSRWQKIGRGAVGLVISALVGGALYEILRSIL